jgi:hypothetical protein
MLKKEFDFILQDQLIYSSENKAGITAKRLLLRAPNTRLLSLASKLSSIVMAAFIKINNEKKPEAEEEKKARLEKEKKEAKEGKKESDAQDGQSFFMLISGACSQEQIDIFVDKFQELILSDGICLIDGKEPLTSSLFEMLDSREASRLIGDYVTNFLLPSDTISSAKKK